MYCETRDTLFDTRYELKQKTRELEDVAAERDSLRQERDEMRLLLAKHGIQVEKKTEVEENCNDGHPLLQGAFFLPMEKIFKNLLAMKCEADWVALVSSCKGLRAIGKNPAFSMRYLIDISVGGEIKCWTTLQGWWARDGPYRSVGPRREDRQLRQREIDSIANSNLNVIVSELKLRRNSDLDDLKNLLQKLRVSSVDDIEIHPGFTNSAPLTQFIQMFSVKNVYGTFPLGLRILNPSVKSLEVKLGEGEEIVNDAYEAMMECGATEISLKERVLPLNLVENLLKAWATGIKQLERFDCGIVEAKEQLAQMLEDLVSRNTGNLTLERTDVEYLVKKADGSGLKIKYYANRWPWWEDDIVVEESSVVIRKI